MSTTSSFDDFFASEFPPIALVAGVTCRDMSRGEDIAQEALARASSRWAEIQKFDKPGAWVRRVAINLALNEQRRDRNEQRALRLVGEPDNAAGADSRLGDPEVWRAVDALPPRQRAAVVLFYVDGVGVGEIAEILEIAVSTATSHLHKARAALASSLTTRTQQ